MRRSVFCTDGISITRASTTYANKPYVDTFDPPYSYSTSSGLIDSMREICLALGYLNQRSSFNRNKDCFTRINNEKLSTQDKNHAIKKLADANFN